MNLYPLKFHTIFKDKIWGGNKIKTFLQKDFSPLPNCGETWEISGIEGNISVVRNGILQGRDLISLIEEFKGDLLGDSVYKQHRNKFPLLLKFIDAADDLSIQVHPNEQWAMENFSMHGKTEMWYIIQADPGASIISGFNTKVNPDIYLEKLKDNKLHEILRVEEAYAGDTFFLPAGRIHSVGKGLLLAEIQQSSDLTFRIYDFNRIADNGMPRELHTTQALKTIDFDTVETAKAPSGKPVSCEYFVTNKITSSDTKFVERRYSNIDSFVIHTCVKGAYEIMADGKIYPVHLGECVLIPAALNAVRLIPIEEFEVLETYVSSSVIS